MLDKSFILIEILNYEVIDCFFVVVFGFCFCSCLIFFCWFVFLFNGFNCNGCNNRVGMGCSSVVEG